MALPDPLGTAVPPPSNLKAEIRVVVREFSLRLKALLRRSSTRDGSPDDARELAEQLLTSTSKALQTLESGGEFSEVYQGLAVGVSSRCSDDGRSEASSGKRKAGEPVGRRVGQRRRSHSQQRVEMSKTTDDGYTWRKYGQKGIQSAAHPRSYFRCTHKNDQGCQAQRQVQKREDDPSVYVITYIGQHTCTKAAKYEQPAGPGRNTGERYLISFGAAEPVPVVVRGPTGLEAELSGPVDLVDPAAPKQELPADDDALSNLSRNDSSTEYLIPPGPEMQILLPTASDINGDVSSGLHSSCVSPSNCLPVDSFPFEDMFNLDHEDMNFLDFHDCDG